MIFPKLEIRPNTSLKAPPLHPPFSTAWKAGREKKTNKTCPVPLVTTGKCRVKNPFTRYYSGPSFWNAWACWCVANPTPCCSHARHWHQLAQRSTIQAEPNNKTGFPAFKAPLVTFSVTFPLVTTVEALKWTSNSLFFHNTSKYALLESREK